MAVEHMRLTKGKFDPSRSGLGKFLNDYEELILRYVWSSGEYGVDSASAMRVVLERLPPGKTVSRTTIIHYLNNMVDRGALGVREVTGKGGHRKIYYPILYENGFIKEALGALFKSILGDFPEETKEIVNGLTRERTHEELQASYEELRSTYGELESAKNELQAANEELVSLNEELENRNTTLSQVSDDLVNLINSTNLPIIIVNADLEIRDITPQAIEGFHMVSTDMGRPLRDINLGIDVDDVGQLILDVISSGEMRELEVLDSESRWYTMQIRPYLTQENEIEGATILFVDITERKKAEEALKESEGKYRSLFLNMLDGYAYCNIVLNDNNEPVDFIYLEINDAFEKLTGLERENVIGKKVTEAIPGIKKAHPELFEIYGSVALTGKDERFDIYFEPLEIWLSISVYSPRKGYFVAVFDNITERKRAEEEIRSLARFPSENNNPVIRISGDGVILYANAASKSFLKEWGTEISQAAPEKWRGYVSEALNTKDMKEVEDAHGDRVYSFSLAPIVDAGYVNVYGRDITDRRKAEEEIRSLARFPAENTNPVLRISGDGTIMYANAVSESLLEEWETEIGGAAPEDWLQHVSETLRTEDKREVKVAHGEQIYSFSLAPIVDAGYVNVYGRDITQRKVMEEELRKSHEEKVAILEGSRDAIVVSDEERFIFINRRGVEMFGYEDSSELISRPFIDLVTPEHQEIIKRRARLRLEGENPPSMYEVEIQRKDGTLISVEFHLSVIDFNGGPATLNIIRDISERYKAEE